MEFLYSVIRTLLYSVCLTFISTAAFADLPSLQSAINTSLSAAELSSPSLKAITVLGKIESELAAANTVIAKKPSDPGFSIGEHIALGNQIKLAFAAHDTPEANALLHMPNGVVLTYGDALSFGDFYGIVGKAISKGPTEADRKANFIAAFNQFATDKSVLNEVEAIQAISKQELQTINTRMKNGETPEAIYKSISASMERQMNCVTGGGCEAGTWWLRRGRYLRLAEDNFDHFGDDAITAYKTGHVVALEQAISAHQSHDRAKLEVAYAMNAFASHFLSDHFAAGHIRTPRNELPQHITPGLVAELLASYMHSEENAYGLHVHDQLGDRWIAYGDWYYFSNLNSASRYLQYTALQASADDIFYAYQYGEALPIDKTLDYIPMPDEIGDQSNFDIAPMFYWDTTQQQLLRRSVLSNPYDHHWTNNWWGWSTLAELREERPLR